MRFVTPLLFLATVFTTAHAQWEIQPSHTTANLRGIHAVSDQIAWASGTEGTVLRTTDGGASWEHCAVPPEARDLDFRGVQAFDANTAIVMSHGKGELSRLYRTTDGCKSWELVFMNPNPEGTLDSVQFQYKSLPAPQKGYFARGILVGHPVRGEFVIYTSKDHGGTWQALAEDEAFSPGPPAVARAGERLFPESNSVLTASADEDSFAFVTGGDGGARLLYPDVHHEQFEYVSVKYTFAEIKLPMSSSVTAGAISVAARRVSPDRVDLMVVGGDSANEAVGTAVFVKHGGPSLNLKKLVAGRATAAEQQPGGYRSAVAYDAGANSWITVGPNGTDVSGDDGRSWTKLSPTVTEPADADRNWHALSLPFVVGPNGRIGRLHRSLGGAGRPAGQELASGKPQQALALP